ncbi:MAG: helix-hairpin-helix domain-containing protein, partial [Desulfatirhabdiaceae bacterium]|nr:helix-hairpin-helix domain-containing protein [Desulfatirhabdiaceae bacterium]
LCEKGFYSIEELSHASTEDLADIEGLDEEMASKLISAARQEFSGSQRKRKSLEKTASVNKPADIEVPDKDESH